VLKFNCFTYADERFYQRRLGKLGRVEAKLFGFRTCETK
jgi:hypothetical protein